MSSRITTHVLQLAVICAPPIPPAAAGAQIGKLGQKIKEKAGQVADQKKVPDVPKTERPTAPQAAPAQGSPGGRKVWANYDFVPGQRTLFFTDFTDETVGNFPRRLQFKSGSMEVAELDGRRR